MIESLHDRGSKHREIDADRGGFGQSRQRNDHDIEIAADESGHGRLLAANRRLRRVQIKIADSSTAGQIQFATPNSDCAAATTIVLVPMEQAASVAIGREDIYAIDLSGQRIAVGPQQTAHPSVAN